MGISSNQLALIKEEYADSKGCLLGVLESWFKMDLNPSWEFLVAAVNSIGEPALADHIAKHYGKYVHIM